MNIRMSRSACALEDAPRRRKLSKRSIKKAQKREAQEQAEQARIDAILDKVSAQWDAQPDVVGEADPARPPRGKGRGIWKCPGCED